MTNLSLVEPTSIENFGGRMRLSAPDGSLLFGHDELACRETGKVVFAQDFDEHLIDLRIAYAMPMVVNSCCRSAAYNEQIGGHERSLHVWDLPSHPTHGTCALDVRMINGYQRGKLVALAWSMGWSVGVASTFVHLDRRSDYTDLPQTMFTYS